MMTTAFVTLAILASIFKSQNQQGVGAPEVGLAINVLKAIPGLDQLIQRQAAQGPLEQTVLAITKSFIEAHRAHLDLHDDGYLQKIKEHIIPHLSNRYPRTVERLVNNILQDAHQLSNEANTQTIEDIDQWLQDPTQTPVYKALWQLFTITSWVTERAAPQLPAVTGHELVDYNQTEPLEAMLPYIIEQDRNGIEGEGRRQFERLFLAAYTKHLSGIEREQLLTIKKHIYKELIAKEMVSWRHNHVFGNIPKNRYEDDIVPFLPLDQMYVEPTSNGDETTLAEFESTKTKINVITADFGMGKSLTSRMLAAKLAQNYLKQPHAPWPVYITCRECMIDEESFEGIFQYAVELALKHVGIETTPADPALPKSKEQSFVLIFDGYDEVFRSEEATNKWLRDLQRRLGRNQCFIFTRPGAISQSIFQTVAFDFQLCNYHLWPFDKDQIQQWTINWNRITGRNLNTDDLLIASKGGIPVLLFMCAIVKHTGVQSTREIDIYEQFMRVTARGKHDKSQERHDTITNASKQIRDAIPIDEVLSDVDSEPMLWLLSHIAWRAHCISVNEQRPLRQRDVKALSEQKLGFYDEQIKYGTLFALQTQGDYENMLFKHKSFQEFLCAKRWDYALKKLANGVLDLNDKDNDLFDAHLSYDGEETFYFLENLVRKWSNQTELREKMHRLFEDMSLRSKASETLRTIHDDRSWIIKRVILQLLAQTGYEPNQTVFASLSQTQQNTQPSNIHPLILPAIKLPKIRLSHGDFCGAHLVQADLSDATLKRSLFHDIDGDRIDFNSSNINWCDFYNADIPEGVFTHVHCSFASFSSVRAYGANFEHARGSNVNFQHAHIEGANFEHVGFTPVNFYGVKATGANFERAHVPSSFLYKGTFDESTWFCAHLDNCNLNNASFISADFRGATLIGSSLVKTDFSKADFKSAKLVGVDARDANFENADFTSADLTDAILIGANFHNSNMAQTVFQNTIIDDDDSFYIIAPDNPQDPSEP